MHEFRRIFMNAVDLTHAVESFRVAKPEFLPRGRLSHVRIFAEHLLVQIELKYADNVHTLDYKLGYDKLLEVLIAFCIDRRVPLPSAGRKKALAIDDEVVLEIILSDEAAAGAGQSDWSRLSRP
ncbi:MAG TPA: hypothetical protein VH020_10495 [Stellaceae bacterium]|nr:hypothetical protein [Stellaceae bacterium]